VIVLALMGCVAFLTGAAVIGGYWPIRAPRPEGEGEGEVETVYDWRADPELRDRWND
jgi:hypothetical protein